MNALQIAVETAVIAIVAIFIFKTMNYKSLKIEQVENGYVVTYLEEEDDGVFAKVIRLFEFEEDDEEIAEKKTMENLLYFVSDFFGFFDDKFSCDNLNIKWDKKGDEHEDEREP